jgi:hypothetical protein
MPRKIGDLIRDLGNIGFVNRGGRKMNKGAKYVKILSGQRKISVS